VHDYAYSPADMLRAAAHLAGLTNWRVGSIMREAKLLSRR